MDIICVTQRQELAKALEPCVGGKVDCVDSIFETMDILNFRIPDAVILDISGSQIDDLDMIEMFPPHGDSEHIPIIAVVKPGYRPPETLHATYFVNDIRDLDRIVERVFALLRP